MKVVIYMLLWFLPITAIGQQGFVPFNLKKPSSFKFKLINHVLLVPVTINGVSFSFLLDTGVKETILFAHNTDSLDLHNQIRVRFTGIGMEDGVDGIRSTGNLVEVGGVAADTAHWVYVVQGEDIDISSDLGIPVNGILGSKFFNSFPVKIDFIKHKISIYPKGYNYSKSMSKYTQYPIRIENFRPYIWSELHLKEAKVAREFLIDLGNNSSLMFFSEKVKDATISAPYIEEYIGRGFGGHIYGKRNRARAFTIGQFELKYPIVSYPDSSSLFLKAIPEKRLGSIASQVLQRFDLLLDYDVGTIFIKKNKNFNKPFLVNMSGIDIRHSGMIWTQETHVENKPRTDNFSGGREAVLLDFSDQRLQYKFVLKPIYEIHNVRVHSRADQAGVKVGDVLLKINNQSVNDLTLQKILIAMQTNDGQWVRLTLKRGADIIHAGFQLVDPIPYID